MVVCLTLLVVNLVAKTIKNLYTNWASLANNIYDSEQNTTIFLFLCFLCNNLFFDHIHK